MLRHCTHLQLCRPSISRSVAIGHRNCEFHFLRSSMYHSLASKELNLRNTFVEYLSNFSSDSSHLGRHLQRDVFDPWAPFPSYPPPSPSSVLKSLTLNPWIFHNNSARLPTEKKYYHQTTLWALAEELAARQFRIN